MLKAISKRPLHADHFGGSLLLAFSPWVESYTLAFRFGVRSEVANCSVWRAGFKRICTTIFSTYQSITCAQTRPRQVLIGAPDRADPCPVLGIPALDAKRAMSAFCLREGSGDSIIRLRELFYLVYTLAPSDHLCCV